MGAAASGALPPAQSLIADYFPPDRRATAFAGLNAAMNIGYLLGVGIGGFIAATWGWRAALIFVGALGLVLAPIVRFTLPEPRCQRGFPGASAPGPRKSRANHCATPEQAQLSVCGRRYLCVLPSSATGHPTFLPSFMIRTLHASLGQVSATWGLAITAANVIGALVGGALADRLSRRDVRWYGVVAGDYVRPRSGYLLGSLRGNRFLQRFIAIEFLAETVLAIGFPAAFAAIHAVCGDRRRAMAVALVFLLMMLCGNGLGPLAVGALSDALSSAYGVASLRYSLTTLVGFLLPAGRRILSVRACTAATRLGRLRRSVDVLQQGATARSV